MTPQPAASRLPKIATETADAIRPPEGLPGLNPVHSRLVNVPDAAAGVDRRWHILDNQSELVAAGVTPVGTILAVHGNPTWSYLWRDLVAQATPAGWRVVAVDQLDMGFSERTGAPRVLAQRVADLGDLTNALGIDGPVVTIGHDWGGVVSMGWAVDHPDQLVGLMLLNTAMMEIAW